ncbi:MAG: tetratricopeptide repeat protein [Planctomycetaceae bacterium]|nr:tetratricopeptide repeat protein [Planctomycetaceae bacterium]
MSSGCGLFGVSFEVEREFNLIQDEFDLVGSLPAAEQPEAYRRVAVKYQSLLDKGIRSGQLYYNQGNAWYYAGERGRAIAAYNLALRYLPSDTRIRANLRFAGGANDVAGSGFVGGRVAVFEYLFFWQNWVGVYQKVFCSVLFSALFFVVCVLILFVRKGGRFYRYLYRFIIFWFVVTLVAAISVGYDWYRFDCFSYAVIAVDDAQPRKGNSEQYDKAFTQPVPLGTNAIVIGERGEWLHLRFGDKQDAWLQKSQVVRY